MSLSRIPLPSIALVLMPDRPPLPPRPSVIRFEFDPLQTIYPTSLDPGRVSGLIGVQCNSVAVENEKHNKIPVVDDRFFSCATNDSSTNVGHSDQEHLEEDDGSDARTMLAEKPSTTSRGSKLKGDVILKCNFMALASTIRSLFKLRGSPLNKGVQVTKAVVDE
jgi:hypothetical protein